MIRTAVALAYTGQIGQAPGWDFTLLRPDGEAVSRFGMGMSLAQLPASWVAGWVEARWGAGSSQGLFLLAPWLCVGLAGYIAGRLAHELGASGKESAGAVVLATLASPLGAYAALEFSEPLQAALLAATLFFSLREQEVSWRSFAAGCTAGFAVLTKSSLAIVAPWLLLPLWEPKNRNKSWARILRAGLGALPPLTLWAYWELSRFGRFFGGYADDRFTHPLLEGCWRLLVGWNRGLLWFFPAAVVALGVLSSQIRNQPFGSPSGRAAVGVLGAAISLFGLAGSYWGWHGMEGWGPRLVVAAIPLLAPWPFLLPPSFPGRRWVLAAGFALGFFSNLPPWWLHPTPVANYLMNLRWPEVAVAEAERLPPYARQPTPAPGRERVVPFEVLEKLPAANPWRTYLWLGKLARASEERLAQGLLAPPWVEERPDLVPEEHWPGGLARELIPRPRWGFLGRSLLEPNAGGRVFLEALTIQLIRATERGEFARAWKLLRLREQIEKDVEAAVWKGELLRRELRFQELSAFFASLPEAFEREPTLHLVLALAERDLGQLEAARARFQHAVASLPGTLAAAIADQPPASWPATLAPLLVTPRRDASPELLRTR